MRITPLPLAYAFSVICGVQVMSMEVSRVPALLFENRGAADARVRYILRDASLTAYFEDREIQFQRAGVTIRLQFQGRSGAVRVRAQDPGFGRINLLLGNNPARWRTNLTSYSGLVYPGIYAGIDLRWRNGDGVLKSEFLVSPGADVNMIRLKYSGMDSLGIDSNGDLVLHTRGGMIREQAPASYTVHAGVRKTVRTWFRLLSHSEVGFGVDPYARDATLVIDPVLTFSTLLGGSGFSAATSAAVDAGGNAYVAGWTESLDFPVTGGLRRGSGIDGFVAKFTPSNTLAYCTYIGGTYEDRVTGIAVDPNGRAVIAGYTSSADMPFIHALQPTLRGTRNAFVAKLDSAGSALIFGTYLGGSMSDSASAIALDPGGSIVVAGNTTSSNFPSVSAFQPSKSGQQDGYVAKIDSSGSSLLFSTFLGGSNTDNLTALAIDSTSAIYAAGSTLSANFPLAGALRGTIPGQQSGFVTKLSSNGRALVYSTFLAGSAGTLQLPEYATGIAVDGSGAAYVVGVTSSTDFPVVNGYLSLSGGGTHGYVAKFTPAGNALAFSTYFGGSGRDWPLGIAVHPDGSIYVCGYTSSADLPVVNAVQSSNMGIYDIFLARFTSGGSLVQSTYLGGGSIDSGNSVAVGRDGNVLVAGHTMSSNFPLASPFQSANDSNYSAFLARITDADVCIFGGTRSLVMQQEATRQVLLHCYGGAGGTTDVASTWLYAGTGGAGWRIVGVADFNRDGVPDLVWQNDTTRQVIVHYYGGTGGSSDTGYNWLYAAVLPDWRVAGAADFNRDGVPDLIWQNDTTGQVVVHYYGGTGGATDMGWNWLSAGTGGAGWRVVAAADFNGDGVPDLIWQNDSTRQVVVHYYGGTGGATDLGWDWLYPGLVPGWRVAASLDLNLDSMPDLVWQNDTTGQVVVHYYSRTTDIGWNWISAGSSAGWTVVH